MMSHGASLVQVEMWQPQRMALHLHDSGIHCRPQMQKH